LGQGPSIDDDSGAPAGARGQQISKIVAREFGGGYFETPASTLESPQDVIRFLWQMIDSREATGQPSTLFINEIHQLGVAKGRLSIDQEHHEEERMAK